MEKQIEDYIVLESIGSYSSLRISVLAYIKMGYVPLGGIAVSVYKESTYHQAMVKYSK